MTRTLAATALAALALVCPGCKGDPAGAEAKLTGRRLAAAVATQLELADTLEAPHRCALLRGTASAPLVLEPAKDRVSIVVVAGLRDLDGSRRATLQALEKQLSTLGPDLVVSLGDHGSSPPVFDELITALGDSDRPLVLLPGASDSVDVMRASLERGSGRGLNVIDGLAQRRIDLGPLTFVTLPGVDTALRLAAGSDGCVFTADDVSAAAALAQGGQPIRLLAAAIPPRQEGERGTDLLDGIHLGSLTLAQGLASKEPTFGAVVHGLLGSPVEATWRPRPDAAMAIWPSGTLEPQASAPGSIPVYQAQALLIEATAKELKSRPFFSSVP